MSIPPPSYGWPLTNLDTRSVAVLLLATTLISLLIHNATRYSRSGLPGPPTLPILGSLPWLLPRGSPPKTSLGHLAKKYGQIFEMNFGMRRTVIISDPALADKILVAQSGKVGGERSWMSFTKDMEIDRIFPSACSNDNPIIEPCRRLNMKILRMVGNDTTIQAINETIRTFALRTGKPVDPMEIGMGYGLVLLTDAAFGLKYTCEDVSQISEINQIFNVSREVLAAVTLTSEFYLTYPMLCLLKPWEAFRSKAKARDIRKRFIEACDALETRMLGEVQAAGGWETWSDCTFKQTYGQGSQDGKKISLEETEGFLHPLLQSAITLVAGAHSISSVTAAVLACLAYEPEGQQEKLVRDIVAWDEKRDEDTPSMKKLEDYPPRALAIVRETLRRFSPAPVALPLQTSADIQVSPNVKLHKGTIILPLSEHLNAAETAEWDPDHSFLDSSLLVKDAGERGHFSFGFGRRRCPAADFSERAIAAFVTDLIRQFKVTFEVDQRSKTMEQMMDFEYTGFNQAPHPPRIVLTQRS